MNDTGRAAHDRLDRVLVLRGLAPNRTQAQALILAGRVWLERKRLDKPGVRVPLAAPLTVTPGQRYVSRGGHKLAGVLPHFGVDPSGRTAMDVGASTGGFIQVLLEAGATDVLAIDVGRGQLDWSLRNDPRVHVLEGINARHLEPDALPFRADLATIDVSFISLALVLPPVAACLAPGGEIVALVKPQFEVGRGEVGRGGIVRDAAQHVRVLRETCEMAVRHGMRVRGVAASTLPGAEGNREFFIHVAPDGAGLEPEALTSSIERAVGEQEHDR